MDRDELFKFAWTYFGGWKNEARDFDQIGVIWPDDETARVFATALKAVDR